MEPELEKSINLMEKVITFDGTEALRKDCRFIKGNYYIKEKQCFCIKDKWYRINSEYIVYDHRKDKYILKSESGRLLYGITNILSTNTIEFGHFSRKESELYFSFQGELYCLLDESLLKNNSNIRE
jgi:hypothetical protein